MPSQLFTAGKGIRSSSYQEVQVISEDPLITLHTSPCWVHGCAWLLNLHLTSVLSLCYLKGDLKMLNLSGAALPAAEYSRRGTGEAVSCWDGIENRMSRDSGSNTSFNEDDCGFYFEMVMSASWSPGNVQSLEFQCNGQRNVEVSFSETKYICFLLWTSSLQDIQLVPSIFLNSYLLPHCNGSPVSHLLEVFNPSYSACGFGILRNLDLYPGYSS